MNSRFQGFGYILLLIGIVLFFLGKPVNLLGIFLIFVGLLFPVILSSFYAKSNVVSKSDQLEKIDFEFPADQELIDASLMLGANLHKAGGGDKLAASWIIEFSKHPNPEIRLITTRALKNLKETHLEAEKRLVEMNSTDPAPAVRAATKPIVD